MFPGKSVNSYSNAVSAAMKREIKLLKQLPKTFNILERVNKLVGDNPNYVYLNAPDLVLLIARYYTSVLNNK